MLTVLFYHTLINKKKNDMGVYRAYFVALLLLAMRTDPLNANF